MSTKSKIVTSCVVLLLIGLASWYALRPDEVEIAHLDPKLRLNATELIRHLQNDQLNAAIVAKENVVEIEGAIKEINYLNDRATIILEGSKTEQVNIICDMRPNQRAQLKTLKTKDSVRLKGVFKGFLKDAIFLNCIITDSKKHE